MLPGDRYPAILYAKLPLGISTLNYYLFLKAVQSFIMQSKRCC